MPRIIQLLNQGETLMNRSEDGILARVRASEGALYRELLKLFDNVDVSAGRLKSSAKSTAFLAGLDDKIIAALKKAGYPQEVGTFVKSFDAIAQNIIDVHDEENGIRISQGQIEPFKKLEVQNTINKLTGAGIAKDFINPIRQALYRNIMTGSTIADTEKMLREYVMTKGDGGGDSKLLRYVKQVARDSVSQFDGSIQANIAQELGLNAKRYVGSLIVDSRGQCAKWVSENNGIIMVDDLAEEIAWAKGKHEWRGRKTGGMIPDTTVNTFDIYRGGYNCRHRSIPTYRRKQ